MHKLQLIYNHIKSFTSKLHICAYFKYILHFLKMLSAIPVSYKLCHFFSLFIPISNNIFTKLIAEKTATSLQRRLMG